MGKRGFTLLEIVISISILAFISIYTATSIQSALQSKTKIQKTIDRDSGLRDALKIMVSDVSQAFNYHDISIEIFNKAQEERKKNASKKNNKSTGTGTAGTPGTTTTNNDSSNNQKTFEKKKVVRLTHFMGSKDELHFTSTSNTRSIKDSPFSDLAEIGYTVKTCRNRTNKKLRSDCLWRRVSNVIDDKVDEGGNESVLLENVNTFRLRYLGPGSEDEWLDKWLTGENAEPTTKDIFPYAVEITIEVLNKNIENDKKIAMTMVAPINFSNNLPKQEPEEGANGQANSSTQK